VRISSLLAILSSSVFLLSCSDGAGTNPFKGDGTDGTGPGVTDPDDDQANPNQSEILLDDATTGLVANRFTFVEGATEADNEIIINNLPFDGTGETRYLFVNSDALGSTGALFPAGAEFDDVKKIYVFENETILNEDGNPISAQDDYVALAINTDSMEAAVVGTAVYAEEGYRGAIVRRKVTDITLPSDGLYVFRGVYAGQRTFIERGGLELVQGDVEMNLDMADFDITGATRGTIFNRVRKGADGSTGLSLPSIDLAVTDDGVDGIIEEGSATTYDPNGDIRDSGSFTGMLGASDSTELAGTVDINGVAEIRRVSYRVGTLADGQITSLSDAQRETIIQALEDGVVPPFIDTTDGVANVVSSEVTSEIFQTDFNASEVGVFITKETERALND